MLNDCNEATGEFNDSVSQGPVTWQAFVFWITGKRTKETRASFYSFLRVFFFFFSFFFNSLTSGSQLFIVLWDIHYKNAVRLEGRGLEASQVEYFVNSICTSDREWERESSNFFDCCFADPKGKIEFPEDKSTRKSLDSSRVPLIGCLMYVL